MGTGIPGVPPSDEPALRVGQMAFNPCLLPYRTTIQALGIMGRRATRTRGWRRMPGTGRTPRASCAGCPTSHAPWHIRYPLLGQGSPQQCWQLGGWVGRPTPCLCSSPAGIITSVLFRGVVWDLAHTPLKVASRHTWQNPLAPVAPMTLSLVIEASLWLMDITLCRCVPGWLVGTLSPTRC